MNQTSQKVAFIGAGYVGLVNGMGIASKGNQVWIVENNQDKLEQLKGGFLPIYEEGLFDVARSCHERLHFTDNIEEVIQEVDYVFITVGTPMANDGSSDLTAVYAVARAIGQAIGKVGIHDITVVMKSTVPVGTTRNVGTIINQEITECRKKFLQTVNNIWDHPEVFQSPLLTLKVHLVDNPEFLKEGTAIKDFLNPDRIIIGTDTPEAYENMIKLYECVYGVNATNNLAYRCTIESAEMIKYASNSMLAMRISFTNMIAHFCEKTGADVNDVMMGVGLDKRIGPDFLKAGCGYGGSCFPKDVQSLIHQMLRMNCSCELLKQTEAMNQCAKQHVVDRINKRKPQVVTLWGVTFKPNSDDLRESPALYIIEHLEAAVIKVYDPLGANNLRNWLEKTGIKNVIICDKIEDSVITSDIIVNHHVEPEMIFLPHSNEPAFEPSFVDAMNKKVFYDIRNQFSGASSTLEEIGFEYIGIGR